MGSYTNLLYHMVIGTKYHQNTIDTNYEKLLYGYFNGTIKNKKGKVVNINGHKNHVHILTYLPPTIAVADFLQVIKTASSRWMKRQKEFGMFSSWQIGYSAFTVSESRKEVIREYIQDQKRHHFKLTYEEEVKKLLEWHRVNYDPGFLFR